MIKKIISFLFIMPTLSVKSQNTLIIVDTIVLPQHHRCIDVAYTCLTVNFKDELMFSSAHVPMYEFLNGILCRYKFNKSSLRLNASFSSQQNKKDSPIYPKTLANNESYGEASAKNYKIGLGMQWTPFKEKELIYSYIDIGYKNRQEVKTVTTLDNQVYTVKNYHTKINGVDCIVGLGTKIKVYKNFYFSGEFGYNYYLAENEDKVLTSVINTPIINEETYQTSIYYFHTFISKLYLSLTF